MSKYGTITFNEMDEAETRETIDRQEEIGFTLGKIVKLNRHAKKDIRRYSEFVRSPNRYWVIIDYLGRDVVDIKSCDDIKFVTTINSWSLEIATINDIARLRIKNV